VGCEKRKSAELSENKGLTKSSGIAESVVLNLPEHEGEWKWTASGAKAKSGQMGIAARKVEVGKEIVVSVRARTRAYISESVKIGTVCRFW
jgi:hypothetical protein